jgi:translation initiation factor 2B subunit (eIF-2B alpha/beta/delta family)
MSTVDQKILDSLFRDIVKFYSSSKTSIITLRALINAITLLECKDAMFRVQVMEVCKTITNSQPRMFPIDNLIILLEHELEKNIFFEDKDISIKKSATIEILEDLIIRLNYDMKELANQGLDHITDGDFIVLHAAEEPVELLLPEAKNMGKEFEVLILRQEPVKTNRVIKIMEHNQIKFTVIPEWDLVHHFHKVTKLFIGAYAITADGKFVSDSGTSNIVSECHIHKLPIYLFAPILEITPTISGDQNIYLKEEPQYSSGVDYTLVSHSCDIVNLELVNHIITDQGEINKDKLKDYCII